MRFLMIMLMSLAIILHTQNVASIEISVCPGGVYPNGSLAKLFKQNKSQILEQNQKFTLWIHKNNTRTLVRKLEDGRDCAISPVPSFTEST